MPEDIMHNADCGPREKDCANLALNSVVGITLPVPRLRLLVTISFPSRQAVPKTSCFFYGKMFIHIFCQFSYWYVLYKFSKFYKFNATSL